MTSELIIMAQEGGGGMGIMGFLPIIAMFGIFYFLLIRPQRQQQKQQEEMRKNLSKGDRVVTLGGVHGVITGITDSTATNRVDEGVSIKFDRSAIGRVVAESKADSTEEKSD